MFDHAESVWLLPTSIYSPPLYCTFIPVFVLLHQLLFPFAFVPLFFFALMAPETHRRISTRLGAVVYATPGIFLPQ